MRMSMGDFVVSHYAFGDDEINYGLYRNANHENGAHPSGSNYYDLDILQTPVLEAFTDNSVNLKSRLITYNDLTHKHLPILKLNEARDERKRNETLNQAKGKFIVAVDEDTANSATTGTNRGLYQNNIGMMKGHSPTLSSIRVRVDQGLDTASPVPSSGPLVGSGLNETEYTIEMDNRLGTIYGVLKSDQAIPMNASFVDDDQIALYKATPGTGVEDNTNTSVVDKSDGDDQVIKGPRGTYLQFRFASSNELRDSNDLFEKIGVLSQTWVDSAAGVGNATIHYIDTTVRVRGVTTGYKLDFPVRFVKLSTARILT
jgi:hypothetical protein